MQEAGNEHDADMHDYGESNDLEDEFEIPWIEPTQYAQAFNEGQDYNHYDEYIETPQMPQASPSPHVPHTPPPQAHTSPGSPSPDLTPQPPTSTTAPHDINIATSSDEDTPVLAKPKRLTGKQPDKLNAHLKNKVDVDEPLERLTKRETNRTAKGKERC